MNKAKATTHKKYHEDTSLTKEASQKIIALMKDNVTLLHGPRAIAQMRLLSFDAVLKLTSATKNPNSLNAPLSQSFEQALLGRMNTINNDDLEYYLLYTVVPSNNDKTPHDISPEFLAASEIVISPLMINGGKLQIQMGASDKPTNIAAGKIATIQPNFAQEIINASDISDIGTSDNKNIWPRLQMTPSGGKAPVEHLSLIGVESSLDPEWLSKPQYGKGHIFAP